MNEDLILPLLIIVRGLTARARTRASGSAGDGGVSTLEMVIIALGLIAVATLLVTAITAAVTRRTNQIK